MNWEVKTMRSATSSSKTGAWWNATLYCKNLTRFWPIWGLYGLIWLLLLPLPVLSEHRPSGNYVPYPYAVLNPLGLALAALFGVLAAMAVFSYLYNSRSVNLMHSLPIRREGLFLTNYLSGLSFFIGPQLVIALLTMAAQGANGCLDVGQVLLWFLVQTLFVLFFYSFAVFCAMFTGHLLALPVFYGILNGLFMGMTILLNDLFTQFIYGFTSWDLMYRAASWLTPAAALFRRVDTLREPVQNGGETLYSYSLTGVPAALLYAAIGLIFAALALWVYRRRRLEAAGDIVSVHPVRPVFKYGVAFCSAVALGSWFYSVFPSLVPRGAYALLALLLLFGLIGYFTAEMLLKKSFKVFRGAWKGGAVFCAVLVCAALVMDLDLIGFNRVPDRDRVVSVSLSGVYSTPNDSGRSWVELTDPADIDAVLTLHRYAAENRRAIREELERDHARWETVALAGGGELMTRVYDTIHVSLGYTLDDGSLLHRQYTIPIYQADLSDPDSPAALLAGLLNRNAARLYFTDDIPADAEPITAGLMVYDTEAGAWEDVSIGDDDDRAALLAAVRSDLEAGRIGIRFLFDDMERYETCYTSNLDFTLFKDFPEDAHLLGNFNLSISLQTTAADTLACLTRLGILDETHVLLTHVENAAREAALAEEETEDAEVRDYDSVYGPKN